jgi:hypothetical protein
MHLFFWLLSVALSCAGARSRARVCVCVCVCVCPAVSPPSSGGGLACRRWSCLLLAASAGPSLAPGVGFLGRSGCLGGLPCAVLLLPGRLGRAPPSVCLVSASSASLPFVCDRVSFVCSASCVWCARAVAGWSWFLPGVLARCTCWYAPPCPFDHVYKSPLRSKGSCPFCRFALALIGLFGSPMHLHSVTCALLYTDSVWPGLPCCSLQLGFSCWLLSGVLLLGLCSPVAPLSPVPAWVWACVTDALIILYFVPPSGGWAMTFFGAQSRP